MLAALILPDGSGPLLLGYKMRKSNTGKLTLIRNDRCTTETKVRGDLFCENIVRVVEVRSHPLGIKDLGIIVVLEVSSSNADVKLQRYLTLDAEKIARAVVDIGEINYCIEVLDATVRQTMANCCNHGLFIHLFFVLLGMESLMHSTAGTGS